MKKFSILLCTILLMGSFAACGSGITEEEHQAVLDENAQLNEEYEALQAELAELEVTTTTSDEYDARKLESDKALETLTELMAYETYFYDFTTITYNRSLLVNIVLEDGGSGALMPLVSSDELSSNSDMIFILQEFELSNNIYDLFEVGDETVANRNVPTIMGLDEDENGAIIFETVTGDLLTADSVLEYDATFSDGTVLRAHIYPSENRALNFVGLAISPSLPDSYADAMTEAFESTLSS